MPFPTVPFCFFYISNPSVMFSDAERGGELGRRKRRRAPQKLSTHRTNFGPEDNGGAAKRGERPLESRPAVQGLLRLVRRPQRTDARQVIHLLTQFPAVTFSQSPIISFRRRRHLPRVGGEGLESGGRHSGDAHRPRLGLLSSKLLSPRLG